MRALLLLLGLTVAVSLNAQEKFFEEAIGWRGSEIELQVVTDAGKQQNCLFLCNGDSIRVFVLDNKKAIIQRFYFTRGRGEEFLGGFIKEGRVHAYFQPSGASELHEVELIIADGVANDYKLPFGGRRERVAATISGGDRFLCVAVDKKASQFVIYDLHGGGAGDTLHYAFEEGVYKSLTAHGFWNRELHISNANPANLLETDWAPVPNKLYARADTLFLLMNKWEKGVTAVFSFDLRRRKVDFRKITHNHVATMDSPPQQYEDNSMLLDDKLYFVSAELFKLDVQIRDFASGLLLKEFSVHGDEEIAFRNTPIVNDGPHHYYDRPRPSNTSGFLDEMSGTSAMVRATKEDSGRIAITIGSWKEVTIRQPMAGGVAGPAYTEIQSSWFKMLVDAATLEHVPGSGSADIRDRVGQYNKTMKTLPKGSNLFINDGRWVYTYYNRDTHSIELTMF